MSANPMAAFRARERELARMSPPLRTAIKQHRKIWKMKLKADRHLNGDRMGKLFLRMMDAGGRANHARVLAGGEP